MTCTSAADAAPTIIRTATPSVDNHRAIDLGFIRLLPANRADIVPRQTSALEGGSPDGRNVSFPAVCNAASMQAGSRLHPGNPGPKTISHATWIEGCLPAVRSNREPLIMCDYSLQFVATRAARVGDKLVSSRFSTSLTRGFAAVNEPERAVC